MRATTWIALSTLAAGSAAAGMLYRRFQRDMAMRNERLDSRSARVTTRAGTTEFARSGSGAPVLLIHGAGGGYDQGLAIGRDLFGPAWEVIAPSRFGYLRTPLPEDASPAAQADAHAALLAHLDIARAVVMGVSAGAPSAIELALRHPGRVSALLLISPRTYHPEQPMGLQPSAANDLIIALMESTADFALWLAMPVARRALVRFLGVPPEIEAAASPGERRRVRALMETILPVSRRAAGIRADGEVVLRDGPLERIATPTLIVAARDDLYRTLPGAEYTAAQIPGAEMHLLETGGHLLVGRTDEVREAVADFLARRVGANRLRTRAAEFA